MFVTDFADAAVTLPLALGVALVLARLGGRRAALAWLGPVALVFAAVLAAKVAFGFVPALGAATGVVSPSGHTAAATAIYGGLVVLFARDAAAGWIAAVVVAAATGLSRLLIQAHTPAEVAIGAVLGLGGMALLQRRVSPDTLPRIRDRLLLGAVSAAIVTVLHGRHAPFELVLQAIRHRVEARGGGPF